MAIQASRTRQNNFYRRERRLEEYLGPFQPLADAFDQTGAVINLTSPVTFDAVGLDIPLGGKEFFIIKSDSPLAVNDFIFTSDADGLGRTVSGLINEVRSLGVVPRGGWAATVNAPGIYFVGIKLGLGRVQPLFTFNVT